MIQKKASAFNFYLLIILFILIISITGCKKNTSSAKDNSAKITVIDDVGRTVGFEKPLSRVVVFNKMNAEIIRALGKVSTIVGIDANIAQDKDYWHELDLNAIAGQKQTALNYEAIVNLNPEAVILPKNGSYEEAIEKLTPFGISVLVVTGWENVKFVKQVEIMAKAYNVEAQGKEYINFCRAPLDIIKERLKDIPESERQTIYFENNGEYKTCLAGSGWNDMLTSSGGQNLFGEIIFKKEDSSKGSVHSFQVDPEEIIDRNPDIILQNVYSTKAHSGTSIYIQMADDEMKDTLSELVKRPGWNTLKAVKNNHVYGISSFAGNACFKIVGSLYLAKWMYPDLFKDIKPDEFFAEWLEKYQQVEPLKNGYVYHLQ